jgi:hypothetical protein
MCAALPDRWNSELALTYHPYPPQKNTCNPDAETLARLR